MTTTKNSSLNLRTEEQQQQYISKVWAVALIAIILVPESLKLCFAVPSEEFETKVFFWPYRILLNGTALYPTKSSEYHYFLDGINGMVSKSEKSWILVHMITGSVQLLIILFGLTCQTFPKKVLLWGHGVFTIILFQNLTNFPFVGKMAAITINVGVWAISSMFFTKWYEKSGSYKYGVAYLIFLGSPAYLMAATTIPILIKNLF
jgi:hypothetical protein